MIVRNGEMAERNYFIGVSRQTGCWATMQIITKVVLVAATLFEPIPAVLAAGECLEHPLPFKMEGDTVTWPITVVAGDQCVEGLRYSTMQITDVSIAVRPVSGRLQLSGPSFRYFALPDFQGTDTFTITVKGTNRSLPGFSTIKVDVTIR